MKVLAIIGSLRKANTYRTVQQIEELHRRLSGCEYEYVFLKDLNLGLCKGCFACISKGEDACPLKDGRDGIARRMEACDAVILACPNYAANVPWIMKNFIDRFAYTAHRPRYFNQKFMLVVTSGSYMGVNSVMKALTILPSGGRIVSRLAVFHSPGMNDKKKALQEKRTEKAAYEFARALSRRKVSGPPFSFLIWFSVFKASSGVSRDRLPADYAFYKDKDYFTDEKLNALQRLAVRFFIRFFRVMIKMGLV